MTVLFEPRLGTPISGYSVIRLALDPSHSPQVSRAQRLLEFASEENARPAIPCAELRSSRRGARVARCRQCRWR